MESAQDLMKEYIEAQPAYYGRKWQNVCGWYIARDFERDIGKSLIYADKNEFITFFSLLLKDNPKMTVITLISYISLYRRFFNWLIKERGFKRRNPIQGPEFRSTSIPKTFDGVINKMYFHDFLAKYDEMESLSRTSERNRYIFMFVNLFYYGMSSGLNIANIKEKDVNENSRSIMYNGRQIFLPEDVFEELKYIHKMKSYIGETGREVLLTNEEGCFIGLPTDRDGNWPKVYQAKRLSNMISEFIAQFDSDYSTVTINRFGFLNYMIGKYGEETTKSILNNYIGKVSPANGNLELKEACERWGYLNSNGSIMSSTIAELCLKYGI